VRTLTIGLVVAVAILPGIWVETPSARGSATTIGHAAVEALVDHGLDVEGAVCKHEMRLTGTQASPPRFLCRIPEDEGGIEIRVARDGQGFSLVGRSVRRIVPDESPGERSAAAFLDAWKGVSHVVCSQGAGRSFRCDADLAEEGFDAGVELTLRSDRRGYWGLSECRLTRLGSEPGARFACQHLVLGVDQMESTLQGLEEGATGERKASRAIVAEPSR
jgi:hypothetical protein